MPATATVTIDSLIAQHAANLAYVAEATTPATGTDEFMHHLTYAAENFSLAGINGHEDLHDACTLLIRVREADGADKEPFLLRTAALLKIVPEMTGEYRTMVGE